LWKEEAVEGRKEEGGREGGREWSYLEVSAVAGESLRAQPEASDLGGESSSSSEGGGKGRLVWEWNGIEWREEGRKGGRKGGREGGKEGRRERGREGRTAGRMVLMARCIGEETTRTLHITNLYLMLDLLRQ